MLVAALSETVHAVLNPILRQGGELIEVYAYLGQHQQSQVKMPSHSNLIILDMIAASVS